MLVEKLNETSELLLTIDFALTVQVRGVTREAGGHNSPGGITVGAPKSRNSVTSRPTFFNAAHLLPKNLKFEHGGAKPVSCPGAI